MAVKFPSLPFNYTDQTGREFDFTEDHGKIRVRVHYGLNEINQIFEDHLFVETKGHSLSAPVIPVPRNNWAFELRESYRIFTIARSLVLIQY